MGYSFTCPIDLHTTSCFNINIPHPAYVVCLKLAIIVELNACGGTLMKFSDAAISVAWHRWHRPQATHETLECNVNKTLKKMKNNTLREHTNQVRSSLSVL